MDDAAVVEYWRRAEEVDKLVKTAISEAHRQAMLRIAQQWRALADQREQYNRRFRATPARES